MIVVNELKNTELLRQEYIDMLKEAGYTEEEINEFSLKNIKDAIFLINEGERKETIWLIDD